MIHVRVLFLFTDEALKEEEPESLGRHPSKPVRHYLLGLYTDYLDTSSFDLIHRFADAYEHARHDPKVSLYTVKGASIGR